MGDCHDHFGKWISHIAQLQLYHFWKIMQMGGLLERMFHNHKDFLAHDDSLWADFDSQQPFSWNCVQNWVQLQSTYARNVLIPVHLQVLTILGFLATSS